VNKLYRVIHKCHYCHVWDPGSAKNSSQILAVKKHLIPDPDPRHCRKIFKAFSNCLFEKSKNKYWQGGEGDVVEREVDAVEESLRGEAVEE
jgi:hypothetical protein